MRNAKLVDINFREIVDYGGQPPVKPRYKPPLHCSGYCISCKESGLLKDSGGELDLMSHGCDSSDFEAILGPLPRDASGAGPPLHEPVMFLLENPGADYGNGAEIEFQRYRKLPPINGYYWAPKRVWPRRLEQFENWYGPYFAYLMWRHQLSNVYITNLIKCRFRLDGSNAVVKTPFAIEEHCMLRFLAREIAEFRPRLVFCFGAGIRNVFRKFCTRNGVELNALPVRLLHPAYISGRCQVHGRTPQECVGMNDAKIRNAVQAI